MMWKLVKRVETCMCVCVSFLKPSWDTNGKWLSHSAGSRTPMHNTIRCRTTASQGDTRAMKQLLQPSLAAIKSQQQLPATKQLVSSN